MVRYWLKMISITFSLLPAFGYSGNAQSLIHIMAKYGTYDMDKNGTKEIEGLSYLPFEAPNSQEVPNDGRLVLVLVEPRLLKDIPNSTYNKQDLLNRLERWKGDLRAEGYYSRFIVTQVYNGTDHQDGRTVLAMRKFLQDVYANYPNLQGVMLVGSFPEAMLVREWLWKRDKEEKDTLTIKGQKYANITYVRKVPERISHRTDIILGDLNGGWENIYQKEAKTLPCFVAIPDQTLPAEWPVTGTGPGSPIVTSSAYEVFKSETMEDFFYVKDAKEDIFRADGTRFEFRAYPNQHPELNQADRLLVNPTSQPEIVVSRINTRHISFDMKPSTGLVDANGVPKAFTGTAINFSTAFQADSAMERTLLIEYFDRNHMHRVGGYNHLPFNLAATSGPDFKASNSKTFLNDAGDSWNEEKEFNEADLVEYINFLKYSAVVKGYRAHGDRFGMQFFNSYDPQTLYSMTGLPYRWSRKTASFSKIGGVAPKYDYVPDFQDMPGTAEWGLHRTLWQNKKLTAVRPSFYFYVGCEANSPANSEYVPYNHISYGQFNNAENILYFLNGLAAMTRAKTFNDDMNGFPAALKEDVYSNLGDGWKAHYRHVATRKPESPASGKRSYWWSVLGDWTLRLRYSNGAAILGFKPDKPDFEAKGVQADHTSIGSHTAAAGELNMDVSSQTLIAAGDINSDTREDFLAIDAQGIGVAYHDGKKWQTLLAKPNYTIFGNWTYNAGSPIKDKIEGHGDFDGDGSHEILIRSSSKIGILKYSGTNKTFSSIIADPTGTVYTDQGVSWTLQGTDVVEAIADFNGDKSDDILIRGSKGRVVLSYLLGKLYPLIVVNYTTVSPGPVGKMWMHNSTDKVVGVADFSAGSAKSILLMHPGKGLGIMNVTNSLKNKFLVQNIHPAGTRFGEWLFNPNDNKIEAAGDFTKDGKDELVVTSPWGIGLLTITSGSGGLSFNSLVAKPRNTGFGPWFYSPTINATPDKIIGVGDFDTDGACDILIQKPQQAMGILKLNAATSTFSCPETIFYNNTYITKPIDGWYPQYEDLIVNIGNYDGLPGAEILMYRKNALSKAKSARTSNEEETEVSSNEFSFDQTLIYPNPATDILTIRSQGATVKFIEVYSLTGNLLINQTVNQTIRISGLAPGIYIVHLKNEQGIRVKTEKLIKL